MERRKKKDYSYRKDAYYFTIKSSPRNTTMFRETKEDATDTFKFYQSVGKQIEWLGKWTGKKFVEANSPTF